MLKMIRVPRLFRRTICVVTVYVGCFLLFLYMLPDDTRFVRSIGTPRLFQPDWLYAEVKKPTTAYTHLVLKELENNEALVPKEIENSEALVPKELENSEALVPKELENSKALVPKELENSNALEPKELENNEALVPKKLENNEVLVPKELENSKALVPKELENNTTLLPKELKNNEALVPKELKNSEATLQATIQQEENKGVLGPCFLLHWNGSKSGTLPKGSVVYSPLQTNPSPEQNDNSLLNGLPKRGCHIFTLPESADGGRIGNNMFRVAAVIGTAMKYDFLPVIPPDNPLTEWFDLPNLLTVNRTNMNGFQAEACCKYYRSIESLDTQSDWVLYGYLQSLRYFDQFQTTIKKVFKIKDMYIMAAEAFLRRVRLPGVQTVCVHVRRGDMDHVLSYIQGYAVASVGFITRAMEYYESKFAAVQFIVVSDDIKWCKNNIVHPKVTFSPFTDPGSDMALMTFCDHVIVTSGSFGWWGAYLARGETVYYAGFPRKGSPVAKQTILTDYYPMNWKGLT